MADNEEGGENPSRGNEWEVVSLTESAYAAAPGSHEGELNESGKNDVPKEEAETSRPLFMSDHFVFPPSQHENLPLEPEDFSVQTEQDVKDVVSEFASEEEGRSSGKDEENTLKGLNASDEFPGIQFSDKKDSNTLPFRGTEFDDGTNLEGLSLIDDPAAKYTSFPNETSLGQSAPYGEGTAIPGFIEPLDRDFDAGDITRSPRTSKDDGHDGSGLPCGAWWKRGAASLYSHAKEANAFWSVFIAAAVMGLVILGQHWQQERWQTLQLKWQFGLNNEKTGRIFGPISRLKDVIVGGHRRGSLIRGSASREN